MGWRTLEDRLVRRPTRKGLDRRAFLGTLAGVAACGSAKGPGTASSDSGSDTGTPDPSGTCLPDAPSASGAIDDVRPSPFAGDPFQLGVASGDPLHDRVILWTRLVVDPIDVVASPAEEADVIWELADSQDFGNVLQQGVFVASPELAHAVHVDVDGLESDTVFWYRFRCGDHTSVVGRTKTLPCPDARPEQARVGFATCQNWMSGFYASHRSMAEAELDLIVFLGDYIYESGTTGAVRDQGASEPFDLTGYRDRHGLYRSDADLQGCHASAPWMAIWDDHEVDNNHAGRITDDADFTARRAAAYQAWYEHMPVRLPAPSAETTSWDIYRYVDLGTLARLILLDGRQHRDAQPCDDEIGAACDEVHDDRTLLGLAQEAWLDAAFEGQSADWVLLANPVVMLPLDLGGVFLNPDQWDGYPTARARLLEAVAAWAPGRTIAFTGDIHAAGVGAVPGTPSVYESTPAVAELIVPATSSRVTLDLADTVGPLLANQAHIEWWDWSVNGWMEAVVTESGVEAIFHLVDDVADPASDVRAARRWKVVPGDLRPVDLDA
jgi:alkaline phosphatase D